MPRSAEVISHWHHSVENFNTSTLDFHRAIESTLADKEAPIRPERIDYHESGVLSAKREYLRLSYGRYSFDISAVPFGKDFFFSWWLVRRLPDSSLLVGCLGLIALPIILAVFVNVLGLVLGSFLFLGALGAGLVWVVKAASAGTEMVEDAILTIPVIGMLYRRFIRPVTYYSEDTRQMFEDAVHRVVLQHVGALLTVSQLLPLSPEEAKVETRKPRL